MPTLGAVNAQVATPAETVWVLQPLIEVPLFLKLIVPVAEELFTVAVNVFAEPNAIEGDAAVRVVVVEVVNP